MERLNSTGCPRCRPPRKPGPLPELPRRHTFTQNCRHPFINASWCLNPDPEQLGDDGEAYRRLQARMIRYRQEDKPSLSTTRKIIKTIAAAAVTRTGNTRTKASETITTTAATHREQGDQQSGSGHHGGVPPSPASCVVAPASGIHYGASHNPNGNPNSRQPGSFRTCSTGGKNVNFTRFSRSSFVRRAGLDRLLACWFSAQHVVPYARPTQRHSHPCFYVEPTGSSAAC